eukprot:6091801-Prymnesium_polylepis.1
MSSWRRRWQFREGAVRPRVFPTMVSLSSVCGPHQPGPSTSSLCMCVSDTHRTTLSFAAMRAISVPPRPHIRFHATTGSTNPNLERPSAANAEQDNIQRSAPKNALTIDGINCTTNATIQTLNIEWGYWRHSGTTAQTWFCKSSGSWSPCIGGSLAGADGGQYCAAGHHGPRCELCDGDQYFHKLDAKCHECGDVTSSATIIFCTVFVVLLTSAGGGAALFRAFRRTRSKHTRFLRARDVVVRKVLTAKRLWKKSGLRYKVKVLVGFFQCVAAVPSVFNVAVPRGLEDDYSRLSHLMELPAEIGSNTVIPAACFGSYHKRLLIGSCWPIALMIVIVCGVIIREIIRDHRKADAALAARG